MTEIRLLTPNDFEEVLDFWRYIPGMGIVEKDDTPEGFARFLRRNPDSCFAAVKDGKIVGTILAGHDGRRGHLYHVAVDPAERGQGIATQLVNRAMNALAAAGITKTALVAFCDNKDGNAFWEKLGFTQRPDLVYRNKNNL